MNQRKLGSSDLEVSEISLGSWLTYSGGVAFEQTKACTDAAFAAGINFFDTANVYGRGEETIEALQQVVAAGKARYLGFSEWTPEQIRTAIEIAGTDLFVSSQPQYSMLWQAPEQEVFPLCAEHGISQIVWSPLGQGILTGKYRPGEAPPADSRAASSAMNYAMQLVMTDERLQAVERLRPVADEAGLTLAELALAWVLRRSELASAIVGASRPEQVHANAKASGITLSPDTLAAIDAALGDTPIKEPTPAPFARTGITRR